MKYSKTKTCPNNWKRVLLEIYRQSPNGYIENHEQRFMDDKHILAKRLNIKGMGLGFAIGFLREHKLIEDSNPWEPLNDLVFNQNWHNQIRLTEKGFNVSFELEKQRREIRDRKNNTEMQMSIVLLTFLIALTEVTNFAIQVFPEYKEKYFIFYCIFFIIFSGGLIVSYIKKKIIKIYYNSL